jgi:Glycosyl transferases group 1
VRQPCVVLPVLRQALSTCGHARAAKPVPQGLPLTLYWVCRLHAERGRGARDTAAMERLAREVVERNRAQPGSVRIVHFGDADAPLQQALQHHAEGAIDFRGHVTDWSSQVQGVVVFLSRYEGFGLAAFEAVHAGMAVCVNEAFPPELLAAAPGIRRIRSGEPAIALLEQLHAAAAPASGE